MMILAIFLIIMLKIVLILKTMVMAFIGVILYLQKNSVT